jgi:hypothetical protein
MKLLTKQCVQMGLWSIYSRASSLLLVERYFAHARAFF